MITYKEIPPNKWDVRTVYSQHDFRGSSFLVHPEPLLAEVFQYSFRELGVYLALASARNVADYLAYGDTTLNLLKISVSENMLKNINNNRLLRIEDKVILHFKYEEVPPTKEIH